MVSRSFDQRLDHIQWTPDATPTVEIVDSILGAREMANARSAGATLLGALVGIVIGLGLKGMSLPGSPWGPETGVVGAVVGAIILGGLAVSVLTAIYSAIRVRYLPKVMQFSSFNLLMIVVLLLS